MRGVLFFLLAFFAATSIVCAATGQPDTRTIATIEEYGVQLSDCDNGKQFECTLAARALARLPDKAIETLAHESGQQCDHGDQRACWQNAVTVLARSAIIGTPLPQTVRQQALAQATEAFRAACESHVMEACRDLARSYWWHRGVPQDKSRVRPLLMQACDGGVGGACMDLSSILTSSFYGFPGDKVLGHQALLRACTLHDPTACDIVANGLADHPETMADWKGPPAVPDLFELSCEHDIAVACFSLAEHLEQGDGIAVNDRLAVDYYRKGCNLGFNVACSNLAQKLRDGEGVAKDTEGARALFLDGCKTGGPDCIKAADMYLAGQPDVASLKEALRLYMIVCDGSVRDIPVCDKVADIRKRIVAKNGSPGTTKPIFLQSTMHNYYPPEALTRHESGTSKVQFTVLPDGTTANCSASGATPVLDAAACDHFVAGLRYKPALDDAGKPTSAELSTSIRWILPTN